MINHIFKKISIGLAGVTLFAVSAFGVTSCQTKTMVDYTHNGSVKLKLDYHNHNFFEDGIGQVTVKTYIDGDTTHFLNVYGDTSTVLKSRYYGIDTPESTGNVQEYGKQASNFTHEKLANAAANGTIVISSPFSIAANGGPGTTGKPEADSTGSRYLSLVWINETVQNAPVESLVLLNLWIVQEGLSWAKGTSEVPAFADTFSKAQKQAEEFKLKLWSGKPDPLFNYGEYETTSLYDIKQEILEFFEDPDHVNAFSGANVRFTGVVAGYSDHTLYLQEHFFFEKNPDGTAGDPVPEDEVDPEHPEKYIDEWAGINVFVGMSAISEDYTKTNTYLEICGLAQDSETFGFQVTDTQGRFPASLQPTENQCRILLKAEDNTGIHAIKNFTYTAAELNANIAAKNFENLYCRTTVVDELVCTSAYINDAGDEATVYYGDDYNFNSYMPFVYQGDPTNPGDSWMSEDKFLGKTFTTAGVFAYHKTSSGKINYQIVGCGHSDLSCKTPRHGSVTGDPYTVSEAHDSASEAIENVTYYVGGKIGGQVDIGAIKVSEAKAIAEALSPAEGKTITTVQEYVITGYVVDIKTAWDAGYKNITLSIADTAGAKKNDGIQAYRCKAEGIDGSKIEVGDKLTIKGNLSNYRGETYNSLQIANGIAFDGNEKHFVSFTMVEDTKTITVVNAKLPSTDTEEHLSKIVNGSYASIKGIPYVDDDENVYYYSPTLLFVNAHGQYMEDPLTPKEANDLCATLEKSIETEDTYYVSGVVSEIVSEYNTSSKRMSFKLRVDGVDFLVTDAKMGADPDITEKATPIDYTRVKLGVQVLISSKLLKTADGTYTTYKNGCQVRQVFDK